MNKNTVTYILIVSLLFLSCERNKNINNSKSDIYYKVDSLMKLMTLQEKIGQTVIYSGDWSVTGPVISSDNLKHLKEGNLGAMFNVFSAKKLENFKKLL